MNSTLKDKASTDVKTGKFWSDIDSLAAYIITRENAHAHSDSSTRLPNHNFTSGKTVRMNVVQAKPPKV